jgi:hypothetical protein
MKKNNLFRMGIALALAFVLAGAGDSSALAEESQSVTLTTSDSPVAGETFQVHVNYDTSDGGSSGGIGLTLYFNSEDVTYTGAADYRDTRGAHPSNETIIPGPGDVRDDEALDGGGDADESTDSYIEMKWVDANNAFGPGVVATLEFTLIQRPTRINAEPDPPAPDTDYSFITGTPLVLIEQPGFHTIIASATPTEAGNIFPSGNVTVINEADEMFEVSVNPGYAIDAVTVDGAAAELAEDNTYTFPGVTSDHSIAVTFKISMDAHTITALASPVEGGGISPGGAVSVDNEADQTFTVSVNEDYAIDAVTVDGAAAELAEDNTYTFTAVTGDHSISVSFRSTISGDINGDGAIDLADAIAALKILAGIQGAANANANADADVNGDDAIGLPEVIYPLRNVAR